MKTVSLFKRMVVNPDSVNHELAEARAALLLAVEELQSPRRWPKAKREATAALLLQKRESLKTLAAELYVLMETMTP